VSPAARLQPSVLTARERQVAALIAGGKSNREIANELGVAERTAGTHVQNILNKLGLDNRVQIATWWAHDGGWPQPLPAPIHVTQGAEAKPAFPGPWLTKTWNRSLIGLWCAAALVMAASDGPLSSALSSAPQLLPGGLPLSPGPMVYQALFTGAAGEFGPPFIEGDPTASQIRVVRGSLEFAISKPRGQARIEPVVPALPGYFSQLRISVGRASLVTFWYGLTQGDPDRKIGAYVIKVDTYAQTLQLGYDVQDQGLTWLSKTVAVPGMQQEREFSISALVAPPRFEIFLDNNRVIDVLHSPNVSLQAPTFRISGDGAGIVRMTRLNFYLLK